MKRGIRQTLPISAVLLAMALIIFCSGKIDANDFHSKIASRQQLIGYWELVQWPEAEKMRSNKLDPWPGTKYQWYGFFADGHLCTMMTTRREIHTRQELEDLFRVMPPVIQYTLRDNGVMIVTRTDVKNYGEIWNVFYCVKQRFVNGIDFLPGDILMVLKNRQNQPVYYRHLRKVN